MRVESTARIMGPAIPFVAPTFVQRLAQIVRETSGDAAATVAQDETADGGATTLTPAMLRAVLLGMGAAADNDNLALSEAFAQLGLPLSTASLAEAHAALARAPGASPLAYALAKSLALPLTPASLRALTTVTGGIPSSRALPADLMDWLALELDGGMETESLAAHLHLMVNQAGQSTEHRIAAGLAKNTQLSAVQDTKSILLRLAQAAGDRSVRLGADTLASHLEGQQLINQASQRDHASPWDAPLYFALPLQLQGEQTMAELRLWPWDSTQELDYLPDETEVMRVTVRVGTSRLGRIQADLAGTLAGKLSCRLGTEKPAAQRLFERYRDKLTVALMQIGWHHCKITCWQKSEWTPLWHGGDALTTPRARVDRRA